MHDVFTAADVMYEIYNDGDQLLRRLDEVDPDKIGLIITDIEMPRVDGFQVASFVKESHKYGNIPVVVNSSMTTSAVKGKMEEIGVDRFIGKTDIESLYFAARDYL